MSEIKPKSKLIKRPLNDQPDVPQKRPRIALNPSAKVGARGPATKTLNIPRYKDTKNKSTLTQVQGKASQSKIDKPHGLRTHRKPIIFRDDAKDETTIIEIDDSFIDSSHNTNSSLECSFQMNTSSPNRRMSRNSFGSCSFVTASEVGENDETLVNSKTPLQQRLNQLKKSLAASSSTSSSTKTLTPCSDKKVESKESSSRSPPKGLKSPLKRTCLKRSFDEINKSCSASSVKSKDDLLDKPATSKDTDKPSILKRIVLASTKFFAKKVESIPPEVSNIPLPPSPAKFSENSASKRLKQIRESQNNRVHKTTLQVKTSSVVKDLRHNNNNQTKFNVTFPSKFIKDQNKHISPVKRISEVKLDGSVNKSDTNFIITLPPSSASNRLKLIKEKNRLEEVQASSTPKPVSKLHSYETSRDATSECQSSDVTLKKFDNKSSDSNLINRPQKKTSFVQNRLLTITFNNNKEENPDNKLLLNKQPSTMDIDSSQEKPVSQEAMSIEDKLTVPSTSTNKSLYLENWIDSVNPPSRVSDAFQNDSLVVNVDDTLLNKTELLTEQQEDASMEWDTTISENVDDKHASKTELLAKEQIMCIVTDTNVFLHDLHIIRELLALSLPNQEHKLKILIPWMVQQEIDSFKDSFSSNLRPVAVAAQKLINSQLLQRDAKVIGQSINDVCDQVDLGKSPDDKILACLLQAGKKYETVILLSNDIGLRNKAISNNFNAYTPKEILVMLRNSKCLKIKIRLQHFLSQVIFHCYKTNFGDLCNKMASLQGCPWPFDECIKRFKKHWSSAFQQVLLKHCLKCIDELLHLCSQGDILDTETTKITKFKDKVKELLFYLQDIQQFNVAAKKMREEVDKVFNS